MYLESVFNGPDLGYRWNISSWDFNPQRLKPDGFPCPSSPYRWIILHIHHNRKHELPRTQNRPIWYKIGFVLSKLVLSTFQQALGITTASEHAIPQANDTRSVMACQQWTLLSIIFPRVFLLFPYGLGCFLISPNFPRFSSWDVRSLILSGCYSHLSSPPSSLLTLSSSFFLFSFTLNSSYFLLSSSIYCFCSVPLLFCYHVLSWTASARPLTPSRSSGR